MEVLFIYELDAFILCILFVFIFILCNVLYCLLVYQFRLFVIVLLLLFLYLALLIVSSTSFVLFFLLYELINYLLFVFILYINFNVRLGFAFSLLFYFMLFDSCIFMFSFSLLVDRFINVYNIVFNLYYIDSSLFDLLLICILCLFVLIKLPLFPFYS